MGLFLPDAPIHAGLTNTMWKPGIKFTESMSTDLNIEESNSSAAAIRPPVVAGQWYPDQPEMLAQIVDTLLNQANPVDGQPLGLVVPHAGYIFSGAVAASGFRQLRDGDYQLAVIIAADHRPPLSQPIAVWAKGGFETPLGTVPVDEVLAEALIAADPRIHFDPAAHLNEHPIEIELPFLQRVCPNCRIIPILMSSPNEETVEALTKALLTVLPDQGTVVIASSDLAHYPKFEDAFRVDQTTLAAIETGRMAEVRATIARLMAEGVPNLKTCACGLGPILVTMGVAAGRGADTTTVLHYANSGHSPRGNADKVVGYGAVMMWRYQPLSLTFEQQQYLLKLARATIAGYLQSAAIPNLPPVDPALLRRAGAFVTLRSAEKQPYDRPKAQSSTTRSIDEPTLKLRGCMGHIPANLPLYQVVQNTAVSAATADPRLSPITIEALDDIVIEISILSPLERITRIEEIEIGHHGLLISQGEQRGLLLPEVAERAGWSRRTFLEQLCRKAQLPPHAWQEGVDLYRFTTLKFKEQK